MHTVLHSVPQPYSRPLPTHASVGVSWSLTGNSGSVSCGVTAPFSWVLVLTRISFCPPKVCFSSRVYILAALWWVNGNLLQEGLCHTQVCCTQSPCPCSSPLLTSTSSGDTQTQFCLSFCGVSGSWCTQGSVCTLQESVPQSCVSSGCPTVGLMETSSKMAYAIPRDKAPRAPAPAAVHC